MVEPTKNKLKTIRRKYDGADNQFELLSKLPSIHGDIKEYVSSDYTLATLNDEDKIFIRENFENASFVKNLILRYLKYEKYEWDDDKMDWVRNEDGSLKRIGLSETEKEYIIKLGDYIFNDYMNTAHMIVILARNNDKNFLVKLLGMSGDSGSAESSISIDDRDALEEVKRRLEKQREQQD